MAWIASSVDVIASSVDVIASSVDVIVLNGSLPVITC